MRGVSSILKVTEPCDPDMVFEKDNNKTNVCVRNTLCTYDEKCLSDRKMERYLGDRWCCTKDTNCLQGYSGPLCQVCDNKNRYFGSQRVCNQCSESYMIALSLTGSVVLIIVFLAVTIYGVQEKIEMFMIQKTLKILFRYYCNVNTMISSYTKILTSFLQNTALIFQIINKTPK